MFGLGLSTLNTVVNGLNFSPLANMLIFFTAMIVAVAVGLPLTGLVARLHNARLWSRIEKQISRDLIEERAARWAMLVEENELRRQFGLPTISAPRTVVPAPYEAIAASTAAVLAAERGAIRVAEARAEAPAA